MIFKNNPPALKNLPLKIILVVKILAEPNYIHAYIMLSQILQNLQFGEYFQTVQFFYTPCIYMTIINSNLLSLAHVLVA